MLLTCSEQSIQRRSPAQAANLAGPSRRPCKEQRRDVGHIVIVSRPKCQARNCPARPSRRLSPRVYRLPAPAHQVISLSGSRRGGIDPTEQTPLRLCSEAIDEHTALYCVAGRTGLRKPRQRVRQWWIPAMQHPITLWLGPDRLAGFNGSRLCFRTGQEHESV